MPVIKWPSKVKCLKHVNIVFIHLFQKLNLYQYATIIVFCFIFFFLFSALNMSKLFEYFANAYMILISEKPYSMF